MDLLAAIAKTEYLSPTLTNPTPVGLTFQHMLSLVNITLTNSTSDVYMQIKDINFQGIIQDDCLFMINRENTEATKSKREVIWENINNQYDSTDPNDVDSETSTYTFWGNVRDIDNGLQTSASYLAPGQSLEMTYFVIPQNNNTESLRKILLTTQSYHRIKNSDDTYSYALANANSEPVVHEISLALSIPGHTSWLPGFRYNYSGSLGTNAQFIQFAINKVTDWNNENNKIEVPGTIVTD